MGYKQEPMGHGPLVYSVRHSPPENFPFCHSEHKFPITVPKKLAFFFTFSEVTV